MSKFVTHFVMLNALISSKTRVKLLLKFFLNSNTKSYLRGLENDFGDSTNAIRVELNRMEKAGMLVSFNKGNKKYFQANTQHPLYREIHNIILKYVGIDKIVETVIERLGDVDQVFLVGRFARGLDSQIIDLVFVGKINKAYLINLVEKTEQIINRKIRYVTYLPERFNLDELKKIETEPLLLWSKQ